MKLDPVTELLFAPFDREVASPQRRRVRSQAQFERFIDNNNGLADCYATLLPAPYTRTSYIYFDFDDVKGIEYSVDDARKFYVWLLEEDFTVIPVISGKKGFHFYIEVNGGHGRLQQDTKMLMHNAGYFMIETVFGPVREIMVRGIDGKDRRTLRNEERLIAPDPTVIGDARRITRIPNTLRPPSNLTWCTYLPVDWHTQMDLIDLIEHMKSPHVYEYPTRRVPMIEDFPKPGKEYESTREWEPIEGLTPIVPLSSNEYLKRISRPCLYRHVMSGSPAHHVRAALTVDLLVFLTPDEIFNIFAGLGWSDWNPEVTRTQIESLAKYEERDGKRVLKTRNYGCKKLRSYGIPRKCCEG